MSENKPLHIPSTAGKLPKHWHCERLDEVCAGTFDCPHSTPVLTDEGPLVVRSPDLRSGVFRMEDAGRVSEEIYAERIARAEPRHGDVLYSREGTYFGIAAEIPPSAQVCLGRRMVLLRPNDEKVHFRFRRYWLNSPFMARHIHGHRDGKVAERLNMPTNSKATSSSSSVAKFFSASCGHTSTESASRVQVLARRSWRSDCAWRQGN